MTKPDIGATYWWFDDEQNDAIQVTVKTILGYTCNVEADNGFFETGIFHLFATRQEAIKDEIDQLEEAALHEEWAIRDHQERRDENLAAARLLREKV